MSIKPKLSRFDLTMIVVSLIIGLGIFRTPGIVALRAGNPIIFFSAWIFGGIICWFGAITFAEIGSRFPVAGGSYKVLSFCYRPEFAFMVNWIQGISNAASIGALALVGSEFLVEGVFPAAYHNNTNYLVLALVTVFVLFIINFLGIKMGANAQNLLSVVKIGLILVLAFALIFPDNPVNEHLSYSFNPLIHHPLSSLKSFGLALIGVFFAYEGYQWVINFGGDIIHPVKNIPRAVCLGVLIVIILYFLLNLVFFRIVGFEFMGKSPSMASLVGGRLFGKWGFAFTSILLYGSVLGYINAGFLSNPRMFYAMAEDGILPPLFKKVNPKTQVQDFVITLFAIVIFLSMVFAGTFEKMLNYIIFFDNIGLGAGAASLFILRKRNYSSNDQEFFTIHWYPFIPLVFISALTFVSFSVFIQEWKSATISFFLFLGGYPLYFLLFRYQTRKS
jgi:APA family basic amino acid/polyamine antiporter